MFPESDYCPAVLFKNRIDPSISIAVARKLRPPPLSIGLRGSSMDGASMPEAAVEEHRKSARRPNDVTAEWVIR